MNTNRKDKAEKPRVLKTYLDQFRTTVQRYFPVPAGADLEAFVAITARYPVFELEAVHDSPPPQ